MFLIQNQSDFENRVKVRGWSGLRTTNRKLINLNPGALYYIKVSASANGVTSAAVNTTVTLCKIQSNHPVNKTLKNIQIGYFLADPSPVASVKQIESGVDFVEVEFTPPSVGLADFFSIVLEGDKPEHRQEKTVRAMMILSTHFIL